jgi:hypothetical protein
MTEQNIFFNGLPIWFINLDRTVDRLNEMLSRLESYGITEYKKISAVDGKSVDLSIPKPEFHNSPHSSGEMGAMLSYIKGLNEFMLSEHEYVLICDDDVDFSNSLFLNFNFFDTLKYHNPSQYCLKLNALDIGYWHPESNYIEPNVLTKPNFSSFGNATIINKEWAMQFLKKYNVLGLDTNQIDRTFIYKYTNNVNNIPKAVVATCDSLMFDEHSFVWRIFGVFDFDSNVNPDFWDDNAIADQKRRLTLGYNDRINSYDWKSFASIDAFKDVKIL